MSSLLILPPPPTGLANTGSISAGTAAATLGQVVFSNSNGVSFGVNGQTVTASVAGGGGGNTGSISAGTTRATLGEVVFSNSNGLTFGVNGQTVTGSHNGLTSQSNQALSGSNGSFTFQTATFGNLNGLSFYTSNGSMVGSYTVPTVPPETPFGVSAGTQSVSTGTVVFANSNGITFGMSNSNQITASHNGITSQTAQTLGLYATSNTTQSSSGTQDARSLTFAGAGIASVGVTNGSVVVSVPAGGGAGDGGVFAGVSNLGNTAGSTGTVSTGNFVLAGSNGITLSQSTGAAGSAATVTILGDRVTLSSADLWDDITPLAQSASSLGQNSVYFWPKVLDDALYVSNVLVAASLTAGSSSATSVIISRGYTLSFGIYSRHSTNNTVLTQHYSTTYTMAASISSNVSLGFSIITGIGNSTSYNTTAVSSAGVALSASVHGARYLILPVNSTLSRGEWWFAVGNSSSSGGGVIGSVLQVNLVGFSMFTQNQVGVSLASSLSHILQGGMMGVYSVTSGALPAGVSQTQIRAHYYMPIAYAQQVSQ